MITAITVLHVLTCFILVVIVLLQTGKGADMGAVFGGGSSATLFGSSGAGNLLTKVTTAAAFIFMVTSLILAYSSAERTPATIFDRTGIGEEEAAVTNETAKGVAPEERTQEASDAGTTEAAAPADAAAPTAEGAAGTTGTEAAAPTDGGAGADAAAGGDAGAEAPAGEAPGAQP
jgi:preprotein translocase subunit SecG